MVEQFNSWGNCSQGCENPLYLHQPAGIRVSHPHPTDTELSKSAAHKPVGIGGTANAPSHPVLSTGLGGCGTVQPSHRKNGSFPNTMGILASDGARGTCNSSDRRAATSEHPSATAPTSHLPKWCGVTQSESQASPQSLPAGEQHYAPSIPFAPWGTGIAAQLQPQGLCGPAPEEGAGRASRLAPKGLWD